jgi:hypothetical protein
LASIGVPVTPFKRDMSEAAAEMARSVLAGTERPLVELRQDALAMQDPLGAIRPALNGALLAAVILAVVLAATLIIRAGRYNAQVTTSEAGQVELFRRAFPSSAVPMNVKVRLEAEYRALAPPIRPSGSQPPVLMLRDFASHVPAGLVIGINHIRVGQEAMEIEGSARSVEDVESLARSLRDSSMLRIGPPATQPMPDGTCGFSIRGTEGGKP